MIGYNYGTVGLAFIAAMQAERLCLNSNLKSELMIFPKPDQVVMVPKPYQTVKKQNKTKTKQQQPATDSLCFSIYDYPVIVNCGDSGYFSTKRTTLQSLLQSFRCFSGLK